MTAPAPLVLDASNSWLGNDGNWSSWTLGIGTPSQSFNVIISTSNNEVWVPGPQGCTNHGSPPACAASRGVDSFQESQSLGFQQNESSTWEQIGLYEFLTGGDVFGNNETGLYGLDSVSINSETLENQTVAGIATQDFWLGSLGMSNQSSEFPVREDSIPGLITALKKQNFTPSASFGLSVGASYYSSLGSLVIGGYDRNSISESSIEIPVTKGNIRSLVTTVQSIDATNTLQGTLSLTYDMPNFEMTIDSGVSQMWLPLSLCETLERTLGLMYDPLTQLYLVNDTARNALLDLAPEFTFTLAANSTTNETVSIVLPYAAFDLEVSEPFYNTSRNYFPIRRAVNESLYLLGRAFLQEAYLVVDWEKGNFSISQIRREKGLARDIVSILPPGMEATASSSLRPGAIAGIAVGSAVVVVALIAFAVCVMRRRKIGRKHAGDQVPSPSPQYPEDKKVAGALELEESALIPPEANSNPVHELPQDQLTHQLMSKTIYELPGDRVERELEANAETQRGEQCDTSDVVSERMKRPRK